MTPAERSARARIAAKTRWGLADPAVESARARQKVLDRFLAQVNPNLPEPERVRRAEMLMSAYFTKLAMRSAKVRRPA